MSQGRKWKGLGAMIGALAFAGLVAPQTAQAEGGTPRLPHAPARPAVDQEGFGANITVSGGVDYVTEYVFRGIYQENQGLIVQPYLEVSFDVYSNEEHDISVSPYVGFWSSLHDASSPSTAGNNVYETDYYFGLAIDLPYGFSADVYYTFYTYPGVGGDIQEFAVELGYDVTELLQEAGVPEGIEAGIYVLLAWETAGSKGAYLELGAEVGFGILQETDYPVDLTAGVSAGFSMKDYYGTGEKWGFVAFDVGATASLESIIPVSYGSWFAHAGVTFLILNDKADGSGAIVPVDRKYGVVGTVGIGFEY